MPTQPENRYFATQDADGTWSVIDTETKLAMLLCDEPMVLLKEHLAKALAQYLNSVERAGKAKTLH